MRKRIIALMLSVVMVFMMSACGGGSNSGSSGGGKKGNVTLKFMYGGSNDILSVCKFLIDEFNKTAGKEKGITVKGVPKSGSLDSVAAQQLQSKSGPDLISIDDEYFKRHTPNFEDISSAIDDSILKDLYPESIRRYRYNIDTTTSNESDPLYGVPIYNDTTVLYYNKTVLGKVGVTCISVPEKDLEAFNNGSGKDLNGKTKADYGITVNVPAKGFYRSKSPYVSKGNEDRAGKSWVAPSSSEVLIFNDCIAMNWDEVEDLGMICTKAKNPSSPSQYGYYTEWWFSYGWEVGGDCAEDLSGNGDWTFTLASQVPNYIVQEGKTYKGIYTGTTYNAGDTLDFKDVLNAKAGDKINYKTDEKSYYKFTVNGNDATMRDFGAEISSGVLKKLPSTYDAFSRFCFLAGVGGLNVCPYPSAFNGRTSVQYFTSGTLALLVERVHNYETVTRTMKDDFSVAPMPQYKVYTNPSDPQCDTVAVEGQKATMSIGYPISVAKVSQFKNEAYEFAKWVASDGQKALAENGMISARQSDADTCVQKLNYSNPRAVMDSVGNARPGDWWYMPDRSWIDYWAAPLNDQVRYGRMTFENYMYTYIEGSNERLRAYKK